MRGIREGPLRLWGEELSRDLGETVTMKQTLSVRVRVRLRLEVAHLCLQGPVGADGGAW